MISINYRKKKLLSSDREDAVQISTVSILDDVVLFVFIFESCRRIFFYYFFLLSSTAVVWHLEEPQMSLCFNKEASHLIYSS